MEIITPYIPTAVKALGRGHPDSKLYKELTKSHHLAFDDVQTKV